MLVHTHKLVVPILIIPGTAPTSAEIASSWTRHELAVLDGLRLELQDWWFAFRHSVQILHPVPSPEPQPLAQFSAADWQTAASIAAQDYPMAADPDLVALLVVRGLTSELMGRQRGIPREYGRGGGQYALIAHDALEWAASPNTRGRLLGLISHELGHAAMGWGHDHETPQNVMGWWWVQWPGVGMPTFPTSGRALLSMRGDEVLPPEPCPAPSAGEEQGE